MDKDKTGDRQEQEGLTLIPASSAQQRLWFIQQLDPDTTAYHVPYIVKCSGDLKLPLLEKCLNSLIQRHMNLRSSFQMHDRELMQLVVPEIVNHLHVHTVNDESEAQSAVEHEVKNSILLDQAPLFRSHVYKLSPSSHWLLLIFHHTIFDGWSTSIFFDELTSLYRAELEGAGLHLPELTSLYMDYFTKQKKQMNNNEFNSQLTYWRDQLQGDLPKLHLPTDYYRSAVKLGSQGQVHQFDLSESLSHRIKSLAKQEKTSLFITLLTCFKALLHNYTQQKDLMIGIPFANRNHEDTAKLLGFFVNTLVIRTQLDKDMSFRDYLRLVHSQAIGAYSHSDLPFDLIVNSIRPERDHTSSPFIQVMFNQIEWKKSVFELPGLTMQVDELHNSSSQFEIIFNICDMGETIRITIDYDSGLFKEESIQRFGKHFITLTEHISNNQEIPVSSLLQLQLQSDNQLLLPKQQTESVTISPHAVLHQLFEQQVKETPNSIAISYNDAILSYEQLNHLANVLAHELNQRGVQRNTMVGLCTHRSLSMIIGILAILKAGGAYVPMDPMSPSDRLQYILEDSKVEFLVTQEELLSYLPENQCTLICVNDPLNDMFTDIYDNPNIPSLPEDLAYVIYTSGSTGKPKGCLVQHSHVIHLFESVRSKFEFDSSDTWSLFHSYAFDFSVWEIWGALLHGGRLVIVPSDIVRSPDQFLDIIVKNHVTVLNQTPSAFWPLMNTVLSASSRDIFSLRFIIFGGERLDFDRLQPWFESFEEDAPQLINMYGITETTVHNTYRKITKKDTMDGSTSCIGEPLSHLKLYVLDSEMNRVPIGIPGELYVSGSGVAVGYLNQPELTSERFISNPFHQGAHSRLYRTGDQVRQISEQDYEYWGRLDTQVKIRGYRIEPNEIEAAIRTHSQVKDTIVIPYAENGDSPRLIAYVVPWDHMPSHIELHLHLKKRLPSYMIPAIFVPLSSIPSTANGKVDKSKLPIPVLELALESSYCAADTPLEQQLAQLWEDLLGVHSVGVEHNFFQIGGDSIRSIQLVSAAQKQGLDLKVEHIFQYPTIRELANLLQHLNQSQIIEHSYSNFSQLGEDEYPLLPENALDAYPLTLLQQGMIFHTELSPETASYYVMNSLYLSAPYDSSKLELAFNKLIEKHDVLRTSFLMEGFREPIQIVHSYKRLRLFEQDIRMMTQEEQIAFLYRWWDEEKYKLDLARNPVLSMSVHRRTDDHFQLSLCIHHALVDGWSVASMFTEMLSMYGDLLEKDTHAHLGQSRPLSTTFAEYVQSEKKLLQSEECYEFWCNWLADCSIAKLPRLALKSENKPLLKQNLSLEIPKPLVIGLQKLCQSIHVPLRSVLLAVHVKIMAMLIGDNDIMTGVVYNGRPEIEDGEKVLGLFLNTLPFRYTLGSASWIDFIQDIWSKEGQLLPYRRYPLAQIMQDHGGAPLFETLFNFTNFHVYKGIESIQHIEIMDTLDLSAPIFPLTVDFSQNITTDTLHLELSWDTREFEQIQVESMMNLYQRTLAEVARTPHTRSNMPLPLSSEERQTILYDWNPSVGSTLSEFIPVHRLFEIQVDASPERIAVVDGDIRMSYHELNVQANQIAHDLHQKGVVTETLVGILLNKSWKSVVAILSVLKAGGAYVPLDPTYPKERLDHMLTESGIKLLITDDENFNTAEHWGLDILSIDMISNRSSDQHNPQNQISDDQLAYVIFTSGSTGKPKGAMNTQGGLSRAYDAWNKAYQLSNISCNLQMTSFAFDVFTADVFRTLCSGGKLLLCPQELLMNAPDLYHLILTEQVDFAFFLPAVMRNLVRYLEDIQEHLSLFKILIVGADYWFLHEYKKLQQICGHGTRVINSYGVAEATVDSIYFEGNGEQIPEQGNIPIGRPFANMSAYILNSESKPLLPGMIGELCIGGSCVGRGYINRPDLTDDKFIKSPFVDGERLYKTGDLARYWPDGNIEFIGRRDHQMKIRGYRVEVGEIESALRELDCIKDAIVVTRENEDDQVELNAYLSFTHHLGISVHLLKSELKKKLPEYMIPHHFIQIESMPLNPNGKIDRKQVADSGGKLIKTEVTLVTPRNKTELLLSSIISALLRVETISVNDNIFDLGADSLIALRIVARIRSTLHVELSLRLLFAMPTIAELAREISRHDPSSESLQLTRTYTNEPSALSFAQQRIWFFEQLQPGTSTYHVPFILDIEGTLDIHALKAALDILFTRHEGLRTRFHSNARGHVQQIVGSEYALMKLTDLSDTHLDSQPIVLQSTVQHSVNCPFHLDNELPVRVELIRLRPDKHVFILTMHHIITDGWSVDLLIRELAELYTCMVEGTDPHLPELSYQYADYAIWQRQFVNSDVVTSQLQYWMEKLSGAPEILQLPLDFERPQEKSYIGETESVEIPAMIIQSLQKLAQDHEATLFIVLLSAFNVLLSRYTGQEDIVIGTPVSNRNHTELEDIIGIFVNTLVIRSSLTSNLNFNDHIQHVKLSLLEAISHSDLPFEHLVSVLKPDRSLSHTPLFQAMFLMEQATVLPSFSELCVRRGHPDTQASKCDLTLSFMEIDGQWMASMTYDVDLFRSETIANMLDNLITLLNSIVETPDVSIQKLRLITNEQLTDLLKIGAGPEINSSTTLCLHDLFLHQASITPHAIACICEDHQLTYDELNRRSNQLANFLRVLGVSTNVLVGLYTERSLDMIIGLLGILKAGGAYVPLDPSLPMDRISMILESSDASVIVTQSHLVDSITSYCPIIQLDEDWEIIHQESDHYESSNADLDSAAYVLYTTGSTGVPKGVVVEHRQIVNYVVGITENLHLNECSSFAMIQPLVVDSSQTVLFPAFYSGGTLHILNYDQSLNAPYLADYFTKHSIDCMKIAPSHLRALQHVIDVEAFLPKMRLILGGESSSSAWAQSLLEKAPNCHIYNHYGPTETTVGVSTFKIQHNNNLLTTTVPIGYPLPNVSFYTLDPYMNPVPRGVPGELWVGGYAVTRGYLNRDELTEQKYMLDPFMTTKSNQRMYKTGDQVRLLPDESFEFIGRLDDQLKINGFRVEPSEVIHILCQHPDIREAVVMPQTLPSGSNRLVAYLVPSGQHKPDYEELNHYVLKYLPSYFLPYAYLWLPELPRTLQGKVNRKALPHPDYQMQSAQYTYTSPRNAVESQMADLWSNLLGYERVGIDDNFFQLGGDSILSMQFIAHTQQLGWRITLKLLFQHQTIAALAQVIAPTHVSLAEQNDSLDHTNPYLLHFVENSHLPHFFCIHPITGSVHSYHELARMVQSKFQFIGVKAPSCEEEGPIVNTLSEMAHNYIQAIQTIQPHGPYHLGGWSMGGMIAYEMAQILGCRNEIVSTLLIMDKDAYAPPFSSESAYLLAYFYDDETPMWHDQFLHMDSNAQIEWLVSQQKVRDHFGAKADLGWIKQHLQLLQNHIHLLYHYMPQSYEGDLLVIASEDTLNRMDGDKSLGWNNYVNQLHTLTVPGDHYTFIQYPHVEKVAQLMLNFIPITEEVNQ